MATTTIIMTVIATMMTRGMDPERNFVTNQTTDTARYVLSSRPNSSPIHCRLRNLYSVTETSTMTIMRRKMVLKLEVLNLESIVHIMSVYSSTTSYCSVCSFYHLRESTELHVLYTVRNFYLTQAKAGKKNRKMQCAITCTSFMKDIPLYHMFFSTQYARYSQSLVLKDQFGSAACFPQDYTIPRSRCDDMHQHV